MINQFSTRSSIIDKMVILARVFSTSLQLTQQLEHPMDARKVKDFNCRRDSFCIGCLKNGWSKTRLDSL